MTISTFKQYISSSIIVIVVIIIVVVVHSSSKATKNESSRPDEIPQQMLPMGMWGPENMKIENI